MEIERVRWEIRCLMLDAQEQRSLGDEGDWWTFLKIAEAMAFDHWQEILDTSSDPVELTRLWTQDHKPAALHLIAAETKTDATQSEWLTVSDAATAIGCDARSVREMISSGKLKATEIGNGTQRKTYKIKRTDIEALAMVRDERVAKPKRGKSSNQTPNDWGL